MPVHHSPNAATVGGIMTTSVLTPLLPDSTCPAAASTMNPQQLPAAPSAPCIPRELGPSPYAAPSVSGRSVLKKGKVVGTEPMAVP